MLVYDILIKEIHTRDRTDGCWFWRYGKGEAGYGHVWHESKTLKAHKVSFSVANNVPYKTELFVSHSCDNTSCYNPEHLALGTVDSNMFDRVRRTKHSLGVTNCKAKLTEADVLAIRARHAQGNLTYDKIGKEFNVSLNTIFNIIKGKTWTHI